MKEIKVVHANPPIPVRNWDYIAYRDGDEESGLRGNGETKQQAIDDLLDHENQEQGSLVNDTYFNIPIEVNHG